jgi:hypothetical protein
VYEKYTHLPNSKNGPQRYMEYSGSETITAEIPEAVIISTILSIVQGSPQFLIS